MNRTGKRLLIACGLFASLIVLAGSGYFFLGHGRWTLWDSFYMAIISVSTVGFSELPGFDKVVGARVLTACVILTALGAVAYFQSALTALLLEGVIGQAWRRNRMKQSIDRLSGHIVVCGVGSTGRQVVEELVSTRTPFVAVDRNKANLEKVSQEVLKGNMLWVHGDATFDHTLQEAGVARATGVIACLTHDPENLFVALSSRSANPNAKIVAKVTEMESVPKMMRAGATSTVSPNLIGGRRMASELIRPVVVEFLDQMMRDKSLTVRFEEIDLPEGSPFAGRKLSELPIDPEMSLRVVALRGVDKLFHYNPGGNERLIGGTSLIVLGATADVRLVQSRVMPH